MIHKNIRKRSAVFEDFHGMDASSAFGDGKCYRLKNFRARHDGSLQKREGYRHIATLPDRARGTIAYTDGGEEVLLAAAGSSLCRVQKSNGALTVSPSVFVGDGKVTFFKHGDALYILDGEAIYRYEGGVTVTRGNAYIPIIGNAWLPDRAAASPVFEEPNLLTNKALYTYLSNDTSSPPLGYFHTLYFDRAVEAVECIVVGDTVYGPSDYTLAADRKSVTMNNTATRSHGLLICAFVILGEAPLLGATAAFSHEGQTAEQLYLYGASDASAVYENEPNIDRERPQIPGEPTFPLYFPASRVYRFGEERRITALTRLGGRLLAFSDRDICVQKGELGDGSSPDFMLLCGSVGASAPGGVFLLDDTSFLCVSRSGVYKVSVDLLLREECRLTLLSEPVRPLLGDGFYTGAMLCPRRRESELWCADPSGRGEVFVLRPESGEWYLFDGIRADFMLDLYGDIVFLEGQFVNLFDAEMTVDGASYGELPIVATAESTYFDFGAPERDKRLSGFLALADLDGGSLDVRIADDGYLAEFTLSGAGSPTFSHLYERGLRSGRFRLASVRLCSNGRSRTRIWRAQIFI